MMILIIAIYTYSSFISEGIIYHRTGTTYVYLTVITDMQAISLTGRAIARLAR